MEGQTLAPPNGQNGPKETGVQLNTTTFTIPVPDEEANAQAPETWYCLEIQVTSTEEGGAILPTPHAWQAPVVEDMPCDIKAGLTEEIGKGPGWAVLFY